MAWTKWWTFSNVFPWRNNFMNKVLISWPVATSHDHNQCRSISMKPYVITRPQWVTVYWSIWDGHMFWQPSQTLHNSAFITYAQDDVIKWKHFPRYWPFLFTGYQWIPPTKASDAKISCLLWSAPEQTFELTIDTPVIWDVIVLVTTSL